MSTGPATLSSGVVEVVEARRSRESRRHALLQKLLSCWRNNARKNVYFILQLSAPFLHALAVVSKPQSSGVEARRPYKPRSRRRWKTVKARGRQEKSLRSQPKSVNKSVKWAFKTVKDARLFRELRPRRAHARKLFVKWAPRTSAYFRERSVKCRRLSRLVSWDQEVRRVAESAAEGRKWIHRF